MNIKVCLSLVWSTRVIRPHGNWKSPTLVPLSLRPSSSPHFHLVIILPECHRPHLVRRALVRIPTRTRGRRIQS